MGPYLFPLTKAAHYFFFFSLKFSLWYTIFTHTHTPVHFFKYQDESGTNVLIHSKIRNKKPFLLVMMYSAQGSSQVWIQIIPVALSHSTHPVWDFYYVVPLKRWSFLCQCLVSTTNNHRWWTQGRRLNVESNVTSHMLGTFIDGCVSNPPCSCWHWKSCILSVCNGLRKTEFSLVNWDVDTTISSETA